MLIFKLIIFSIFHKIIFEAGLHYQWIERQVRLFYCSILTSRDVRDGFSQ